MSPAPPSPIEPEKPRDGVENAPRSMALPGRVDPSKIDVRVEQAIAEVVVPLPASET